MNKIRAVSLALALCVLAGCGQAAVGDQVPDGAAQAYVGSVDIGVEDLEVESVPLSSSPPALVGGLMPEASGKEVKKAGSVTVDYSNVADGYVMVRYKGAKKKIAVQVKGPTDTYTYFLSGDGWETFPLSDGNGSYKVKVLESVGGSRYAAMASVSFQVTLKDEFAPFVRPNQYVDYEAAPDTVAKAAELAGDVADPLEKVGKVYDFVVGELTYDYGKAATVKSGYLPVLDEVLKEKKGICFDYASLMAGMLRSQGVPCKLVVGYAGTAYHAWISVWTEEDGWVDGVIWFDGTSWQRMDPTFASNGGRSESIMQYIGDGANYKAKYMY